MPWIQIRIDAKEENAEQISDQLLNVGALSVTFMDAHDTPIYEPIPGEVTYWTNTIVIGLFDASVDTDAIVDYLQQQSVFAKHFSYKFEQLEDKDWEREWMDNFHPIQCGKRLWICPSWREIPDESAVNVMLDPGLAFGTGTHATTFLCLQWLDGLDFDNKTVVDFGCGSGILAVAALKLGASNVIGIDIDPQAIEASQQNAERNNVGEQLSLYLPKDQPELKSDIVVANILAGPLIQLVDVICGYMAPGAKFALSGVLAEQAQSVCDVYAPFCTLDPVSEKDGWVRISGIKKP